MMALPLAHRGVFANIQFFLPITNGLIERSLLLLSISK
ncbi:Transposase [Bacillus thuringiensis serovar monterrey BGSC 4AJ1]|nr:Transposase [Bacillus thuringiensis serovar monterrey BGSC 4AJ1]